MIELKTAKSSFLRREFVRLSRLGRGGAFILFRENVQIDFTREIVDLCLKNHAYDAQCEGERSEYAMQFVRALCAVPRKKVISAVKAHLKNDEISSSWDWNFFQLCMVCAKISNEFDDSLGDILRKRYAECNDETVYRAFPEASLIVLDGFDGLLNIARRKGKLFRAHKNWWEDDFLFYDVPKMSASDVRRRLEIVAQTDENVRAYLDTVFATEKIKAENESKREQTEPKSVFEKVKKLLAESKRVSPLLAKKLSEDELLYFASAFQKEKTQKNRIGYLRLFSPSTKIPYPLDFHDLLFALSPRKNSLYNEFLVDSLSFFSAPEIRALAIRALESDEFADFYFILLKKNYREGDGKKIAQKLRSIKNVHRFHDATICARKIYKENPTADCLEPLRLIYEKTPCALCRSYVAELLEKSRVLPDEIKAELPFDSETLFSKEIGDEK